MPSAAPSIAILTRQVTHYHHPRFEAAGQRLGNLHVISVANEGKFAQVLASDAPSGYTVHRMYQDLETYRAAVGQGALQTQLCKRLNTIAPDVVAISGWASPESYAALSWARENARGVIVMSDSRAEDAPRNMLRDWIKGRVVQACDSALAAGQSHKSYLAQLGMPPENIRLGYDVVDNAYFREKGAAALRQADAIRSRLNLPASYILASGRFIAKKNLDMLITAYGQACEPLTAPPDLVILGEGESRQTLETMANDLTSGKVHLPGFTTFKELPALYALSRGFVHIPTSEQWGLVINEAAATGLPIVASQECGAAQELVQPGRNGWRVPAKNRDEIAKALHAMMTLDDRSRHEMGAASQTIVSDWGPARFADSLVQCAQIAIGSDKTLSFIDKAIIKAMRRRVIETVA
ncbi:glycosyltransferase [Planktotalea sp.]|uniref:glycosyltransferase n=1 Tax=Planktotalea sp. TaxID=2029877 RepID=UPI003D6BBEE6